MDEPEISLHIRWQREIIDRMRQINPFCQIIIATHSPSMFGTGWGDKVVYMEDIIKKTMPESVSAIEAQAEYSKKNE